MDTLATICIEMFYPWCELLSPANLPNWMLAILAGWAGVMALKTLEEIKNQVDVMKTQLNDARQKEMPKLLIKLGDIDLLLADSPDMVSFGCNIQNYGGSAAFLVGGTYVCWLGQTDESGHQTQDVFPMILPEVLAPGVSCDSEMILFDEDRIVDWTLWNTDDPRMVSVREGEKSICACGFVMYETIFGETWKLGFKRRFTMQSLGDGFTTGGWIRDGNADNYDHMQYVHEPPPKRRWWKVRLSRVKAN